MFELVSKYSPSGDQPEAIKSLVNGINSGKKEQVLLGATGTGKTFTMANVIKETNKKLNELCKKYKIKYINVYDKLLNDKGSLKKDYTTDGLHLNDLGYFKVTKVLEKYVSEKES